MWFRKFGDMLYVLKGNPVKVWNCPRNCKCGRTRYPLYRKLNGVDMGRTQVGRSTSQETCQYLQFHFSGVREGETVGIF